MGPLVFFKGALFLGFSFISFFFMGYNACAGRTLVNRIWNIGRQIAEVGRSDAVYKSGVTTDAGTITFT